MYSIIRESGGNIPNPVVANINAADNNAPDTIRNIDLHVSPIEQQILNTAIYATGFFDEIV